MSNISVPTMADKAAAGETPEYLFWVGCAGSYDARYQRVTRAFVRILHHLGIDYAVLGPEETCTGDPAKRGGNEFLFQMQAMQNIEVMNMYNVKKSSLPVRIASTPSKMNIRPWAGTTKSYTIRLFCRH